MKLLAIETATPICGAALTSGETLVVEYRAAIRNAHGRLLTQTIDRILTDAGWQPDDIEALAVSIGPGSFTGLRIGLALAKGIALARGIPIAAVPTLEVLATQAPVDKGLIAPLIRSRADEYYTALYERSATGLAAVQEVRILPWGEIAQAIPPEAVLIGGAADHPPLPGYRIAPASSALPSAFTVARLGWQRLQQGRRENPDLLEPLYLQEFIVGKPKQPVFSAEGHAR